MNLENTAKAVWTTESADGSLMAYPDTCVGTDSHTTMINGLGVLGWGVGGIEAEAAMLGQPVSMLVPDVAGFKLTGKLGEGITATDLVLTVVQMLRAKGVVGQFVEFCGPGLDALSLADRATIANMAPEYGATCGFFPVDGKTIDYLRLTGRSEETLAVVEGYCKANGLWRHADTVDPVFSSTLSLDMGTVEPSLAGPKRPQDKVFLSDVDQSFNRDLTDTYKKVNSRVDVAGRDHDVGDGDVVIAAITSCTNTSNPDVMIAAGLVARKARARGLKPKPWVKTSLAPGSQVVTDYLVKSGLQDDLNAVGFDLVGYGCTTCIGNSGPLAAPISKAINDNNIVAASVLSGNRNFEGRVSPDVRANFLASPAAGRRLCDEGHCDAGYGERPNRAGSGRGRRVPQGYLADQRRSTRLCRRQCRPLDVRAPLCPGLPGAMRRWRGIEVEGSDTYQWRAGSTYIANPPYFDGMGMQPEPVADIVDAKLLALLGDSITTDHISPAGSIKADSPAGEYLMQHQVSRDQFNSYGSRRGNHEVMMRGTFANIRIKNEMVPGVEGGMTRYDGEVMPIYDAAMRHKADGTPLVVVAGKEYGTGSSRDWAAKGTLLLGVRAVITESYERIHRSNLIGMGVLPLQFAAGATRTTLGMTGDETFTIRGVADIQPRQTVEVTMTRPDGSTETFETATRIDTVTELEYYLNGGILQYVLRNLARAG